MLTQLQIPDGTHILLKIIERSFKVLTMKEQDRRPNLKRKAPDSDEEVPDDQSDTQALIDGFETDDDSDDEQCDDYEYFVEKQKQMTDMALKSQEPESSRYNDIKVTPFNLNEELKEGTFDKEGNFTFSRERNEDQEKDNWADSIDWNEVEKKQSNQPKSVAPSFSEPSVPTENPPDMMICYKEMLRIMRPDETVQRCIRRLGDSLPRKKPGQARNKRNSSQNMEVDEDKSNSVMRAKLNSMIEWAHIRLEDGDMDIYQKSYEDLEDAINQPP